MSDKQVLGKFCGRNSTDRFHPGDKPILAPGNRLQLAFQTDDSNHESHLGFTAFFQAVGESCLKHIKKQNSVVACLVLLICFKDLKQISFTQKF